MCSSNSKDESFCLACLKKLEEEELDAFLFGQDEICQECRNKTQFYNLKINYNQFKIFILFKEDEWLQKMWLQYAQKGDSALSFFFFKRIPYKALRKMKSMTLLEIDNPDKSYRHTGGMYLNKIMEWGSVPVFHPYYINIDRNKVHFEKIPLKFPKKKPVLFLGRADSLMSWIEWCVFHDIYQILLLMMSEERVLELKKEGAKAGKWLE